MDKIIFVCTGNTCRSPMAEMIMKDLTKHKNFNIEIKSRGLNVFNQGNINSNAKNILQEKEINIKPHKSTMLSRDDLTKDTLILTMTNQHKYVTSQDFSNITSNIDTLANYTSSSSEDIIDPFGGNLDVYRKSFLQIKDYVEKLVKSLP